MIVVSLQLLYFRIFNCKKLSLQTYINIKIELSKLIQLYRNWILKHDKN